MFKFNFGSDGIGKLCWNNWEVGKFYVAKFQIKLESVKIPIEDGQWIVFQFGSELANFTETFQLEISRTSRWTH